jgi:hypothetical protein
MNMGAVGRIAVTIALGAQCTASAAEGHQPDAPAPETLADAQRAFYNARYEEASALTMVLLATGSEELAVYELRSSALLFQLKSAIDAAPDKEQAFKQCSNCQALMNAFTENTDRGRSLARARLNEEPGNESALFFLGKLDLNYIWLQLGTLGRRTGWDEYWEARRSLDGVLKRNPKHVRARVARAWIDYIVDTRMPWGTAWMFGGGNKKKALAAVRDAANAQSDFFVQAEAEFALWDLHVRERKIQEAVPIARELAQDFPENRELAKFLERYDPDRTR